MNNVTVRLWLFRRSWVPDVVYAAIHVTEGERYTQVFFPFPDDSTARIAIKGLRKAYKRAGAKVLSRDDEVEL